jgi:hypothetical protein
VSFDLFYSNLRHDGHWMVTASFGRVWQPAVYRPGWNPYYDGQWIYTDLGWTWQSDYAWGAIPYHYGTWAYDPVVGWVWVPGYVWAPSWVVFSVGPDYIGWAPVPVRFSIGLTFGRDACPPDQYVFVSTRRFLSPRVGAYAVPVRDNHRFVERNRFVSDLRVDDRIVVNHGPEVRDVERWSRTRVVRQPIERVSRVAPQPSFTRSELFVDDARAKRAVRAAEPAQKPAPAPVRRVTAVPAPRATPAQPPRVALEPARPRVAKRPQATPAPAARARTAPAAAARAEPTRAVRGNAKVNTAPVAVKTSRSRTQPEKRSDNRGADQGNGKAKAKGHSRTR